MTEPVLGNRCIVANPLPYFPDLSKSSRTFSPQKLKITENYLYYVHKTQIYVVDTAHVSEIFRMGMFNMATVQLDRLARVAVCSRGGVENGAGWADRRELPLVVGGGVENGGVKSDLTNWM